MTAIGSRRRELCTAARTEGPLLNQADKFRHRGIGLAIAMTDLRVRRRTDRVVVRLAVPGRREGSLPHVDVCRLGEIRQQAGDTGDVWCRRRGALKVAVVGVGPGTVRAGYIDAAAAILCRPARREPFEVVSTVSDDRC